MSYKIFRNNQTAFNAVCLLCGLLLYSATGYSASTKIYDASKPADVQSFYEDRPAMQSCDLNAEITLPNGSITVSSATVDNSCRLKISIFDPLAEAPTSQEQSAICGPIVLERVDLTKGPSIYEVNSLCNFKIYRLNKAQDISQYQKDKKLIQACELSAIGISGTNSWTILPLTEEGCKLSLQISEGELTGEDEANGASQSLVCEPALLDRVDFAREFIPPLHEIKINCNELPRKTYDASQPADVQSFYEDRPAIQNCDLNAEITLPSGSITVSSATVDNSCKLKINIFDPLAEAPTSQEQSAICGPVVLGRIDLTKGPSIHEVNSLCNFKIYRLNKAQDISQYQKDKKLIQACELSAIGISGTNSWTILPLTEEGCKLSLQIVEEELSGLDEVSGPLLSLVCEPALLDRVDFARESMPALDAVKINCNKPLSYDLNNTTSLELFKNDIPFLKRNELSFLIVDGSGVNEQLEVFVKPKSSTQKIRVKRYFNELTEEGAIFEELSCTMNIFDIQASETMSDIYANISNHCEEAKPVNKFLEFIIFLFRWLLGIK